MSLSTTCIWDSFLLLMLLNDRKFDPALACGGTPGAGRYEDVKEAAMNKTPMLLAVALVATAS